MSTAEATLLTPGVRRRRPCARANGRAMDPETMPQSETPMRLGWKAQSQSHLALEALAMLKQGPAVLARKERQRDKKRARRLHETKPSLSAMRNKPRGRDIVLPRSMNETLAPATGLSRTTSVPPGCKETLGGLGEPAGIRTRDPMIKSHVLYRLSYGLSGAVAMKPARRARLVTRCVRARKSGLCENITSLAARHHHQTSRDQKTAQRVPSSTRQAPRGGKPQASPKPSPRSLQGLPPRASDRSPPRLNPRRAATASRPRRTTPAAALS